MSERKKWMTPTLKQLFVVTGVSLNIANVGSVMGFPAILLPQLRAPDSDIPITGTTGSWIASIIGISLFVGNILVPTLMGKFGRKKASLTSCTILLACWIWIVLATDVTSLLIARFFQGIAVGINLPLCPVMIGEFTSPVSRGIFSSIMASSITATTLMVHVLGSYFSWRTTALACTFAASICMAILLFIPESPSWLADQEKYDDSAEAFKWLRGEGDDDELDKMLDARKKRDVIVNGTGNQDNGLVNYVLRTLKKKEFSKPVLIMIHMHTLSMWTGMVFLIVYTVDILHIVAGTDIDVPLQVTILDIQRFLSTVVVSVVIKKVKRRTILAAMVGINLAVLVALAVYTFAKIKLLLPFDHPAIGIILLHIHMSSVTAGSLPLPLIIGGELFPLEFRSLGSGLSFIAFSLNYFISSKTLMFLISSIGIYGAYALYSLVTAYCLAVVLVSLPETKDRTLQDIENEFKGKPKVKSFEELAATIPLNTRNNENDEHA